MGVRGEERGKIDGGQRRTGWGGQAFVSDVLRLFGTGGGGEGLGLPVFFLCEVGVRSDERGKERIFAAFFFCRWKLYPRPRDVLDFHPSSRNPRRS